jgi:peptide chain release factor 2
VTLFDYDTKVEKRESLQAKMGDEGFWDDQTAAQKIIDKYKLLKAQTEDLEVVVTDFEDAQVGYELAKEGDDSELLTEVDEQLF